MNELPPHDRADQLPLGLPVARPLVLAPNHAAIALPDDRPQDPAVLLHQSTGWAALLDVLTLVVLMVALEVAVTIVVGEFLGGSGAVAESGEAAGASDGATASELAAASREWLVPLLGLRGLGSVVIVSGILLFRRQSVRSVGLARRSLPLDGIIGLGACGVAYLAIILVTMLINSIFPEAVSQMLENAERLKGIVPRLTLGGFLGVAVVIGVYEELVFRGFLMTRLRRATQSWTAAVLISTAVFTALHAVDQTPVALVWITILSLIFSAVTIWRRSIVPAIVAHVLFDFTQFVGMALQSGESWT